MTDDELIANHIAEYAALLQQQVEKAGNWPVSFVFPDPASNTERTALSLFIAELEQATGKRVKFTTQPGSA
jgi:hypothetical protein